MGTRPMIWMGDGTAVEMTRDELRADVEDGIAIAVKRGKVPPLDESATVPGFSRAIHWSGESLAHEPPGGEPPGGDRRSHHE